MKLDPEDAEDLEEKLVQIKGLKHLRVKKRGDSLVIYSGPSTASQHHAKLTLLGGDIWGLSLPKHTGRWEPTPFTGTIDEILKTLVGNFRCYLENM